MRKSHYTALRDAAAPIPTALPSHGRLRLPSEPRHEVFPMSDLYVGIFSGAMCI